MLFATVLRIAIWIGSGIVTWGLTEPDSFGQTLGFLIIWGVIGKLLDFILMAIVVAIFGTER